MQPYQRQLVELLTPLDPRLIVEVGVERGETSRVLLEAFPSAKLYMVDSWREADADSEYRNSGDRCGAYGQQQHDENWERTCFATEEFGDRARFLPTDSISASRTSKQFDAVFIDADHTYPAVKSDLNAWWPRVRPGGILCGHDYTVRRRALAGVKRAVDERFGDQVQVGEGTIWWVNKEA